MKSSSRPTKKHQDGKTVRIVCDKENQQTCTTLKTPSIKKNNQREAFCAYSSMGVTPQNNRSMPRIKSINEMNVDSDKTFSVDASGLDYTFAQQSITKSLSSTKKYMLIDADERPIAGTSLHTHTQQFHDPETFEQHTSCIEDSLNKYYLINSTAKKIPSQEFLLPSARDPMDTPMTEGPKRITNKTKRPNAPKNGQNSEQFAPKESYHRNNTTSHLTTAFTSGVDWAEKVSFGMILFFTITLALGSVLMMFNVGSSALSFFYPHFADSIKFVSLQLSKIAEESVHDRLQFYSVSKCVNNPANLNEGITLITPVLDINAHEEYGSSSVFVVLNNLLDKSLEPYGEKSGRNQDDNAHDDKTNEVAFVVQHSAATPATANAMKLFTPGGHAKNIAVSCFIF